MASPQQALEFDAPAAVGALRAKQTTVLQVVQGLQEWLVSEDGARRAHGTRVLAEVVSGAVDALSPGDVHHLAAFLAARLVDWPCVEHAAPACTALLLLNSGAQQAPPPPPGPGGHPAQGAALAEADALAVVRAAATGLAPHLQELAQAARAAGLRLLLVVTQVWGPTVLRCAGAAPSALGGGMDLLEAAIAAVDGEKDPRCLLAAFELLQAAVRVYHAPGVSTAQLSAHAEEVVEVISCYFPVSFTPPKNDPHKITRAQLAHGLEGCMAASPFLARWALPLVLEKLSSTYRPAKEDALSALATCCCSYGSEAIQDHLSEIWSALRNEVLAPSAFGVVGGEELSAKRGLAAAAASCLGRIMARLPATAARLQELAVKDACTTGLVATVRSAGAASAGAGVAAPAASDPGRTDRSVMCTAALLGAVCGGSEAACRHVLASVVSPLMALLPSHGGSSGSAAGSGGAGGQWDSVRVLYCLTVVRGVLQGVAATSASAASCSASDGAPVAHDSQQQLHQRVAALGQDFVQAVVDALAGALHAVEPTCMGTAMQVDTTGANGDGAVSSRPEVAVQVLLACIALWRELLTVHAAVAGPASPPLQTSAAQQAGLLSSTQLQAAVRHLTRWALVAEGAEGGDGAASGMPEGVVSVVPARMAWGEGQDAHVEALAGLQQAVGAVEAEGAGGGEGAAQAAPGPGAGEAPPAPASAAAVAAAAGAGGSPSSAAQQHVLQQLLRALVGASIPVGEATGGTSAPAQANLPPLPPSPPPPCVRARALHAATALAASSPSLALALASVLAPLVVQLLRQQEAGVGSAAQQALSHAPSPWPEVTQELLVLLGHLPAAWASQPAPPPHACPSQLAPFVTTLLGLPLCSALLQPAAVSAASAAQLSVEGTGGSGDAALAAAVAAARRALRALRASCARLASCCTPAEQQGVALAACEAVAGACARLQGPGAAGWPGREEDALAGACAACACLAGLQQGVLGGAGSALQLVDALCDLAVWQPPPPPPHETLAHAAGAAGAGVVRCGGLQHAAATALASVLNKWPGGAGEAEGAAARVLGRWGLPAGAASLPAAAGSHPAAQGGGGGGSAGGAGWVAAAWVARALCMRGSPTGAAIVAQLVGQLAGLEGGGPPQGGASAGGAPAAGPLVGGGSGPWVLAVAGSVAMRVVMGGAEGEEGNVGAATGSPQQPSGAPEHAGAPDPAAAPPAVPAWHHARTRVLWQQRTLSNCLAPLLAALAAHSAPASAGPQGSCASAPARCALLLAAGGLMGCAPEGALRTEAPRIVGPLLRVLQELPGVAAAAPALAGPAAGAGAGVGGAAQEAQPPGGARGGWALPLEPPPAQALQAEVQGCLRGALHALEAVLLRSEALRPLLEGHAEALAHCLAVLVGFEGSSAVREQALRCTMLLLELPYHLLHPHRQVVVWAVTRALDDNKRSVRQLAVRCRRMWVPK